MRRGRTIFLCIDGAWASAAAGELIDLTTFGVGYTAVFIFAVAYAFVMAEEFTHLRKSNPDILVAGILWAMVAFVFASHGQAEVAEAAIRHNLLEYGELFLFLLVAMTYINAMEERQVFDYLKAWLIKKGFSYRKLFWIIGVIAFLLSSIADNLTTALLMCAVVMAVGSANPKFVGISCVNVVVAANAGGAFSPFGDITTLMVWQRGIVEFQTFFVLFVPSVVAYLIPASIMHFAIPKVSPSASDERVDMLRGAVPIMCLFLATIATAVCYHNIFHLPPVVGMMTGLAYPQLFAYYFKRTHKHDNPYDDDTTHDPEHLDEAVGFDVFKKMGRTEWDTLLFSTVSFFVLACLA